MAKTRLRSVPVLSVLLLVVGCGDGGPGTPPAIDAAPPDAPEPQVSAGTDGPAAVRDLPPYERLPAPSLPEGHGWTVRDVGVVATPGRLQVAPQGVLLSGGGTDIGGTADSFVFAFRKMKGDGEIVARARSVQRADPRSSAGIMVRADEADPAAASVFFGLLADPLMGGQVVTRAAAGQAAVASAPDPQVRNQFLRLRREGRRFTVSRSSDRLGWVTMGSFDIDMPEEVAIGVAATSRSATLGTAAEFDLVRLLASDPAAARQGWDLEPLGFGGTLPAAVIDGERVTISGLGDAFTTTFENGVALLTARSAEAGALTLTARVDSLGDESTPGARVALTFRDGAPARLIPMSRNILISVDARGLVQFQRRDRSTNFEPGMTREGMVLPLWLRLSRRDDPATSRTTVTGAYSTDGMAWTTLDTAEYAVPDPSMAGVIFTSGSVSRFAGATLSGFSLTSVPPSGPDAGAGGDAGAAGVP
jgi:regulation of enolase protein 1 (concanavalin A-like superfamily)